MPATACVSTGRVFTPRVAPVARPVWVTIGVPAFIGHGAIIVVLVLMTRLFGHGYGNDDPVWTLPQSGWQPWSVVMLGLLVPLLLTSLSVIWLSAGPRQSRLRQVAVALLWPLGSMALGSGTDGPLVVVAVPVWWNASLVQDLLISYVLVLVAGALAWSIAWLILSVAEWQPPAHLVRRSLPQR